MSTDEGAPAADETANYYDVVNEVFAELWDANFHHGYWDSEEDQCSNKEACDKLTDQVIDRSGDTTNAKLLDIGSGFGLPAFRLAGRDASVTIVGINNNASQNRKANRGSAELGLADRVSFDDGDALAMPYEDNSFDVVWVFETLPHLDRLAALREVNRVLKPGGRVIVTDRYIRTAPTPEEQEQVRQHEVMTAASPMLQEHEYREVVAAAGLELAELKDLSAETGRTGLRMVEAVDTRWDEIVERYTEGIIPMLEAVKDPSGRLPVIGYLILVARKAG